MDYEGFKGPGHFRYRDGISAETILKWIFGVLATLLVSLILGGIQFLVTFTEMRVTLQSVQAEMSAQNRQMDATNQQLADLRKRVDAIPTK